jgi:hypothetical protein
LRAFGPEPTNPTMRALPGNAEFFGDMGNRAMTADYPLNE